MNIHNKKFSLFLLLILVVYSFHIFSMGNFGNVGKFQNANQSNFQPMQFQAMPNYSKNTFNVSLNSFDEYGFTPLLRAAALVDIEAIVSILERLEQDYGINGNNAQNIFTILNAQNKQGATAFSLLVENGTNYDVKLMLYHVRRLIGSNKNLFFKFLTPRFYTVQWTPLHWLAREGSSEILKTVILVAQRVLGKGSSLFDEFINAQDVDGLTPLVHTYFNSRHEKLLSEYGGRKLHAIDPVMQEARKLGNDLIEAIREDKFNVARSIIVNAQKKYKDSPKLFLEFLTTRTHDGWDALMHSVALGYEYTAFLLHVAEQYFKDDKISYYFVLRSVAQDGRGALIIAILRRSFTIANLLIEKIKKHSPNKYYVYILLNIRTYAKGFTPMLAAVDFSSDKDEFFTLIHNLIDTVAQQFGKNSRAVDIFVNTKDDDGFPPLAYATSPKITTLLTDFGATMEGYPPVAFLYRPSNA